MKVEYAFINGDDVIAIVYHHESLGRVVMVRGNINPEFDLYLHPLNSVDDVDIKKDMMEFLLQSIPEEINEQKTEAS